MQVPAAQLLGGDHLPGRRLDQRRAAQEDRALVPDDHRLVAHGRDVRAAGRAGAEHRRDLRDPPRGQRGLVVEDPPEVLPVREHLVLPGQERPAGVDQVDARQPVVQRDLLRAQVLLHRDRVVGAALHGRVVGDDHAFAPAHPAHAGDDARGRGLVAVHAVRGQRRQLQERGSGIEQVVDPVPGQQLAAGGVPGPGALRPAEAGGGQPLPQVRHQRGVLFRVPLEFLAARIRPAAQDRRLDRHPLNLASRPWCPGDGWRAGGHRGGGLRYWPAAREWSRW